MTILEIEILLHYWCSNTDFRDLSAPAIEEAIEKFLKKKLLIKNEEKDQLPLYQANREALEPYIIAVCSIPVPEMQWILPESEHSHVNECREWREWAETALESIRKWKRQKKDEKS